MVRTIFLTIILCFTLFANAETDSVSVVSDTLQVNTTTNDEAALADSSAVLDLQKANKVLQSRNHMNFLATLLVVALIMMFFIWNIKAQNRKHMLVLERKNNALQFAHDAAVQARNEAEAASRMKTKFIQQITHELRTPLNAISGFTQVLTEPSVRLEEAELIEIRKAISDNTDHLTTMLNDILIISDSESRSTNIGEMKTIKLEDFAQQIHSVTKYSSTPGATLTSDFKGLSKAVQNVVDNAVKFGKVAYVDVKAEQDQSVTISVTDEGPGIDKKDAELIFSRFYKKDSFVPGVGLGLSVARAITTVLGGDLRLDTEYEGKGARFVFRIPNNKKITT